MDPTTSKVSNHAETCDGGKGPLHQHHPPSLPPGGTSAGSPPSSSGCIHLSLQRRISWRDAPSPSLARTSFVRAEPSSTQRRPGRCERSGEKVQRRHNRHPILPTEVFQDPKDPNYPIGTPVRSYLRSLNLSWFFPGRTCTPLVKNTKQGRPFWRTQRKEDEARHGIHPACGMQSTYVQDTNCSVLMVRKHVQSNPHVPPNCFDEHCLHPDTSLSRHL